MTASIDLESFSLKQRIGQGGMGEVWLADVPTFKERVAIKVISNDLMRLPGHNYDQQFVQEVNAVAKLNHPSICRVFDFGYITPRASSMSGGHLHEGSPWFAMEYAEHGTLEEANAITTWAELKHCLTQLLQGLAHAHARGLIHRDIKPGNVLRFMKDGQLRYAMTDFGLALPLDMSDEEDEALARPTGTPYYMSPEQFAGRWRDYGPWTDLYALGCMAYELVCGLPPFTGANLVALAIQHTQDEIPKLNPRFEVPQSLNQWIQTMMAKNPLDRYALAADALWALQALPQTPTIQPNRAHTTTQTNVDSLAETMDTAPMPHHATQQFDPQALMRISQSDQHQTLQQSSRVEHLYQARPPLPHTWHMPELQAPCTHLTGAGLFAMRTTPFVGREAERNQIWEALTRAVQENTPQLLLVKGASGTGKSRLVQWMTERIEELGAAFCIHVHHDLRPGPTHGVGYAFERLLHCRNLSSQDACKRVLNWLSYRAPSTTPHALLEHTARSIVAMMDAKHAHMASFSSENERHAALVLVLSIISQERPLILWLDDLQWSQMTVKFIQYLLRAQLASKLPILLLGTVRIDNSEVTGPLAELMEHDATMTLEQLPLETHREFIQKLLPLDQHIVDKLAERTQGNPLFAIQIVHDWLNNNLLDMTASGFSLKMNTLPELPDALHDLWQQRLAHVVSQGFEDQVHALEIASCLGTQVKREEWQGICALAQAPLTHAFAKALHQHNLLEMVDEDTLRFTHNLLRESIEQHAKQNARWASHHQHCATYLSQVDHANSADTRIRRARHLNEARQWEAALEAFKQCADQLLEQSNYPMAAQAHESVMALCDALQYDQRHHTRLSNMVKMAEVLRYQGLTDRSYRLLKATQNLVPHDQLKLKGDLLRMIAGLRISRNRPIEAEALMSHAITLYQRADAPLGEAKAWHGLGWNFMLTKRLGQARDAFLASYALGKRHKNTREEGWALLGLADYYLRVLELEKAEFYANEAMRCFEQTQTRAGLAFCHRTRAGIMLFLGQFDEAFTTSKEAAIWLHQVESPMRHMCDMMLGMVHLVRGQTEEADIIFSRIAQANDHLIWAIQLAGEIGLLGIFAQKSQWAKYDQHLQKLETRCQNSPTSDLHLCVIMEAVANFIQGPEHTQRLAKTKALAMRFVDTNEMPRLCQIIQEHDKQWMMTYLQLTQDGSL